MSAVKFVAVVGVTFVPAYPNNLHMLAQVERDNTGEPLVAILVRNPANPHDTNAVEVHVPALGQDLAMIGHVDRANAARLAPHMDAGLRFQAWIASVRISPAHPDRPGIDIGIRRVAAEVAA